MSHLPNQSLLDTDPEVKSFIYQQISEFQPYVTPQTVVAVVAKDPRKLKADLELAGHDISRSKLKKMYRIAIVLKEGDAEIADEGLHENVYEAIRAAKLKLLQKLSEIQDQVMSESERVQQINSIMQNEQIH